MDSFGTPPKFKSPLAAIDLNRPPLQFTNTPPLLTPVFINPVQKHFPRMIGVNQRVIKIVSGLTNFQPKIASQSDPNYAIQYQHFQQQLYATNTNRGPNAMFSLMKSPKGLISSEEMRAQASPPSLAHSYNYKQNSFNAPSVSNHTKVLMASYNISNMIAKKCKPFTDGEFIKNCMLNAAEIICPEYLDTFKKIKLSRNTISRRINSLAKNVNEQLKEICKNFKYYSLCLDDTKDYTGFSQLSIFIRGINENFEITKSC